MSETSPFDDAAFVSRLGKLLSMLSTEQPGEAEAARKKLVEHLAHHRLSLTDVAARLRDGPSKASFLAGTREMSLERQLNIARSARHDAEVESKLAQQRAAALEQALHQASFDARVATQGQAAMRGAVTAGWTAAVFASAIALFFYMRSLTEVPAPEGKQIVRVPSDSTAEQILTLNPGEQYGTALVQDLPVRLDHSDDATIRAFLNRGTKVVIEQQIRAGSQTWLMIRSVTGRGWVRGGDVLH